MEIGMELEVGKYYLIPTPPGISKLNNIFKIIEIGGENVTPLTQYVKYQGLREDWVHKSILANVRTDLIELTLEEVVLMRCEGKI
jgi:hypothetical protein